MLEENRVLLSLTETLEVVRLHSVRGQHRGLSSWVFSHKISVIGVLELNFLSLLPILVHLNIPLLLLLSEDIVNSKCLLCVRDSCPIMFALSLFQSPVEVQGLLVEGQVV